jgi:hypothetical protein
MVFPVRAGGFGGTRTARHPATPAQILSGINPVNLTDCTSIRLIRSASRRPGREPRFRRLALLAMALALPSCLVVKGHESGGKDMVMSQEEFGKYVEQVFRYHNQVMNELIESAEARGEMDPGEARELTEAEERMISLCHPLNDVVAASLSGESLGLSTQMDLSNTVPACEEASHHVEDLIP